MPAVGGVGGLVANLFNPGMDADLAKSLTPNANPLAQGNPATGAPGAPQPPQASSLPQPAVAGQDPITGSLISQLLRRQQVTAAAQSLNEGLQGMAAGFGTAQQQHDKREAMGRGGQVPDTLGDVKAMQDIQQTQTDQNEHARFMAGASTLASILFPGDPDGVAKATEVMNNKGLLSQVGQTAASNATTTTDIKNINEYGKLYAKQKGYDADPSKWTPDQARDVASAQANSMAGAMGGSDLESRQYLADKQASNDPNFPDYPTWKAQHAQAATDAQDAHKIALQLPGLKTQLTDMDRLAGTINPDDIKGIFGDVSKQTAANAIFNWDPSKGGMDPATLYGNGRALTTAETNAVLNARQLHLANYASNFKTSLPGQRLSQQEAQRLGNAADQLGNFSGTVDDYMTRLGDVKNRIGHSMTNAHGEAGELNSLPIQYRSKIDPSFLEGPNAIKNLPPWAQPKVVDSQADLDAIPYGQAYKPGPAFGKYAGKILFKGQESGYEDY